MSCFSLPWLEHLLIDLVVLVVVVSILKLFVPWLLSQIGVDGGMIMQIINIIVWGIVMVVAIIVVFALLQCFIGGGFSLMPHR